MSLVIKILGAGQHVGKSASLVHLNNINLLLDCGIQITKYGTDRFPDLESLFIPIPGTSSKISPDVIADRDDVGILPKQEPSRYSSRNDNEEISHEYRLEQREEPPWKRQKIQQSNVTNYNGQHLTNLGSQYNPQYQCILDAVLVTHFHLDHIGALPHLTEVLGYSGPIYMTEPTLKLAQMLLLDCWSTAHHFQMPRSQSTPTSTLPHSSSEISIPIDVGTDYDENDNGSNISDPSDLKSYSSRFTPHQSGYTLSQPKPMTSCPRSNRPITRVKASQNLSPPPTSFFGDVPITSEMVHACLSRVTLLPFYSKVKIGNSSISITAIPAGHVIGASMFFIEDTITNQSILYTGDLMTGGERFIKPAQVPLIRPTITISESTYGGQVRDSGKTAEQELCNVAEDFVRRGGKVLIPTSGIGKAQEIAALLNDHWERRGLNAPILLGTGMIDTGFSVLKALGNPKSSSNGLNLDSNEQAHTNLVGKQKHKSRKNHSQWSRIDWSELRHVKSADVQAALTTYSSQPVVYLSPPKSLNAGASLEILKVWATDPNNLILLPSFSIPGTVAHQIINGERNLTIPSSSETTFQVIELKASMRYFSLASHSDSIAVQSFFKYSAPLLSILVHGEVGGMLCLATNLRNVLGRPVCCPVNNEVIVVQFPGIRAMPNCVNYLYHQIVNERECESVEIERRKNYTIEQSHLSDKPEPSNETVRSKYHGAKKTLRFLIQHNFKHLENWISQRKLLLSSSSWLREDTLAPRRILKQTPISGPGDIDALITQWCPSLASILNTQVMTGPDRDTVTISLMNILKKEEPWKLEEVDIPRKQSPIVKKGYIKKAVGENRLNGATNRGDKLKAEPSKASLVKRKVGNSMRNSTTIAPPQFRVLSSPILTSVKRYINDNDVQIINDVELLDFEDGEIEE